MNYAIRPVVTAAAVAAMLVAYAVAPAGATDAVDLALSLPTPAPSKTAGGEFDRSYRLTLIAPRYGMVRMTADFENQRYKIVATENSGTTLSYVVGSTMYQRTAAGDWIKEDSARVAQAAAKASSANEAPRPAAPSIERRTRKLPDRVVGGEAMSAFSYQTPASKFDSHAAKDALVTVVCLSEKDTGRLRSCRAARLFTASFDHYNDPANSVVLPPAARHAKDITNAIAAPAKG